MKRKTGINDASAWVCDEWVVEFDAHAEPSTHGRPPWEIKTIETATRGNPQEMIDQVADRRDQKNRNVPSKRDSFMKGVNHAIDS